MRSPSRAAPALAMILIAAGVMIWPDYAPAEESAQIGKRITEQKNQLKQVEFERRQIQRRLANTRVQEREALREIRTLSDSIRSSRRRVRRLERDRVSLRRVLESQDGELNRLTREVAASQRRIQHRLRRLYRFSKASESASLFALVRFKSLAKDSRYLTLLRQEDEQAIDRHRQLHAQVLKKRRTVEKSILELALLKEELRTEQGTLRKRERKLRASLKEMRSNNTVYAAYLEELVTVTKRMESAIAKLESRSREQTRLRAPQDLNQLRGRLLPPVQGRVVAAFGERDPRYTLKKFQRGIVIRVSQEEAPVSSIAAGHVVHAGPFRGYQQLVVLDHGSGMFSVYGHLSDVPVIKNTWIEARTRLGNATYQPIDGGYSVYFEIRKDGKPVNPMDWIDASKLTGTEPVPRG